MEVRERGGEREVERGWERFNVREGGGGEDEGEEGALFIEEGEEEERGF